MATKNQSQYINTMVFCVVAGIISLMLMLLVFNSNEAVREYAPLVITIEVGLILIIIAAIWNIIAYERAADAAAKNSFNAQLNVTSCPDYWTQNGLMCTNSYSPSSTVTYTMYGNTTPPATGSTVATFSLSNYNNNSVAQVCSNVYSQSNISPWSQVDSVCGSFRLNG